MRAGNKNVDVFSVQIVTKYSPLNQARPKHVIASLDPQLFENATEEETRCVLERDSRLPRVRLVSERKGKEYAELPRKGVWHLVVWRSKEPFPGNFRLRSLSLSKTERENEGSQLPRPLKASETRAYIKSRPLHYANSLV